MSKLGRANLLIVDDDANTLASLSRAFRLEGHEVTVTDDPARALNLAKAGDFDAIFSDVVMPAKDGLTLLEEIKTAGITTPVVMMSGQAHIQMAVKATRLGAVDFLEKPISTDKLLLTVQNLLHLRALEEENRQLRERLGGSEIIFASDVMGKLLAQVDRVAATQSRVCILGETGTGKELIARRIHDRSPRKAAAFIAVNCAAIPAELIESELFGHEKGSFTGATGTRTGKIEQASGGTLFLDEIGDMPLPMQAKLLRVLEQNEVERIGGEKPIKVDVRVIAATHRDLDQQVKNGGFREDLYHRIFVFPVQLPPLRDRRDDIPALVRHFAEKLALQNRWKPLTFTDDAISALRGLPWKGNVRELRNTVERLALFAENNVIDRSVVDAVLANSVGVLPASASERSATLAEHVQDAERAAIIAAIRRNHHHITNAAKELGLERSHLYKKCQQLGIDLRRESN
jgi:two-component system, NtrC family, nitrogen regulation response regulator NtrX